MGVAAALGAVFGLTIGNVEDVDGRSVGLVAGACNTVVTCVGTIGGRGFAATVDARRVDA